MVAVAMDVLSAVAMHAFSAHVFAEGLLFEPKK
jgi:hypothetical protein